MIPVSMPSLEQLQQENARLLALITRHESTIASLHHQLHLFRQARFGRKSEKYDVPEQLMLQFDEAEFVTASSENAEQHSSETETITYTRNKKGTGRKALPKSLPYIEHIHDLSDAEKQCSCGCVLTHMS